LPTINGAYIHHEVQGDGPPIAFIHGLGATSSVWFAQQKALSKYFRVIVHDRSGSGLSGKRDQYSIDTWVDELAGLLEHLAAPSAVIVGHSLGTMVAQRFAAKYADRTKALVLAGGEAELTPGGRQILTERHQAIEARGLTAVVDLWLDGVLSAATREGNPSLAGLMRAMFLANDPRTYSQHSLVLRDSSVRNDHTQIKCPTLLLVGDQDGVTPLSWQIEIARAIPGSRVRTIPNTAHMTMLESPSVFNAALLDFLVQVELGTPRN
jgi:pimeloyl-ACP methyl ester carboxylesterase